MPCVWMSRSRRPCARIAASSFSVFSRLAAGAATAGGARGRGPTGRVAAPGGGGGGDGGGGPRRVFAMGGRGSGGGRRAGLGTDGQARLVRRRPQRLGYAE